MATRTPVVKKLTLALAVAGSLLMGGNALAEDHRDPVSRLSEHLELTALQQAEIQELFAAHRHNMRESARENRSERREARATLREEIRALLDDEQARKFDEMVHRAGATRRGHRAHQRDGHSG